MKDNKIQNNHYLILSYNSLITNQIIQYFLFLIDIFMITLQLFEIYQNQYESLGANNIKNISFIFIFIKQLNKIKVEIKFVIYLTLIAIETIVGYILNNFNLIRNVFLTIVINLNEIIFQRIGALLIFDFLFCFNYIFLIIGIIISLPNLLIIISEFRKNHLYTFFFKLVKYPYDVFSKIIDLHLLLIKILLAISGMSNKYNLSKLFFIVTIIILLFLQIYLTYIILFKSYYLMNNVSLNKLRYSTLLSNCIIILFFLIINTNEVSNVFFIICFINIFIFTLILFWIFYDPYQFIKFDKDENEENVFYYFFVLDRDKNENLLLENKINEHIDKCGK